VRGRAAGMIGRMRRLISLILLALALAAGCGVPLG
jgi:hypothetical protein